MKEFLEISHITHAIKPQVVNPGVTGVTSSYISVNNYERITMIGQSGDMTADKTMTISILEAINSAGVNTSTLASAYYTAELDALNGAVAIEKRSNEFATDHRWAALHIACNENSKLFSGLIIRSEPDEKPVTQQITIA